MDGLRDEPLRVLVAGGGIAGAEALLALRDLAGDRVHTTLLTPESEFTVHPLRVLEPFCPQDPLSVPLDQLAADAGADLVQDALRWVDASNRILHTRSGQPIAYDVLLIATGARRRPAFSRALTLEDRRLGAQLRGVLSGIETGAIRSLAFIIGAPASWPLPIYELALLTARRARTLDRRLDSHIATAEDAPLTLFGAQASRRVARLLEDHGITTLTSVHCGVPQRGTVALYPGRRTLQADLVMALPQLFGPTTPGIAGRARDGFISVDPLCRVRSVSGVFAAGDATSFPVKLGAVAAGQADVAATKIAELAGAAVRVAPFDPKVQAVLIGGARPLALSAHITGGHGSSSEVHELETWDPEAKVSARYLAPYLEQRERMPAASA